MLLAHATNNPCLRILSSRPHIWKVTCLADLERYKNQKVKSSSATWLGVHSWWLVPPNFNQRILLGLPNVRQAENNINWQVPRVSGLQLACHRWQLQPTCYVTWWVCLWRWQRCQTEGVHYVRRLKLKSKPNNYKYNRLYKVYWHWSVNTVIDVISGTFGEFRIWLYHWSRKH